MGGLDQRVQVVEQELQLLKGQIQTILLQIQEHLLNTTYPALHAQEPGKVSVPEITSGSPVANSFPVKRVALTETTSDSDSDFEEADQAPPKVRSVGYSREPAREPSPPPPQLEPVNWTEPISQERADNVHTWIELDQWVSEKIHKLGIERTRELIELYGGEERELLHQFLNVYDENAPKPAPHRTSAVNGKPVNTRITLVPQTRAVVDEIRAEQQEKLDNARTAMAGPLNKQQELVLRLIAGVLSARDEESPISKNGNGHRKY